MAILLEQPPPNFIADSVVLVISLWEVKLVYFVVGPFKRP